MKTIFTSIFLLFCAAIFAQAGALDGSFGNNGRFIDQENLTPNLLEGFDAVLIQPDGKILLGGHTGVPGAGQDIEVVRLNADGTLDASFGNGGKSIIDFYDLSTKGTAILESVGGIALQADGKIILAGTGRYSTPKYIDSIKTNQVSDIVVARFNSNGSLDASFNGSGKKLIDLYKLTNKSSNTSVNTSSDYCSGVAVRSDGHIILGGSTYNNKNVSGAFPNGDLDAVTIQLNSDGSSDAAYSADGVQIYVKKGSSESINSSALQKDGKLVLAGTVSSEANESNLFAMRANIKGGLDKTFNGTGISTLNLNISTNFTNVILQPNGKILIGGSTLTGPFMVRYNMNGTLDANFGANGISNYRNAGTGAGITLQADGKIIQVGTELGNYKNTPDPYNPFLGRNNFQIIRYKTNGQLDTSFGTYGVSLIDIGNYQSFYRDDAAYACAITADGKIIAAGATSYPYSRVQSAGYTEAAIRVLTSGKNYGLTGPDNQSVNITGCTTSFPNLDPVTYPHLSLSKVRYRLYHQGQNGQELYESGYGSVSNKPFAIGNTTVVYSSIIDSSQRAVFSVNVTGGTSGGALDFDGVDDRAYVAINPVLRDSNRYTFESWIKVRSYTKGGSVVFGNQRNNDAGIVVGMNENGYIITYQPQVGTVTSSYKVKLNTWTHIAFVQSPEQLNLYVNGNYVQTMLSAPNLQTATPGKFYLGAYTNDDITFSKYFNGQMDEVRIWEISTCQTQIQNNLNGVLAGNTNGILAEYTMNNGLAGCNNSSLTKITANYSGADLFLQNFYLDGPVSNFVEGHVIDTALPFPYLTVTSQPNTVQVYSSGNTCGAVANFEVKATSGCPDNIKITYSQNPGTVFPVGTTYVSAKVTDGTGNFLNGTYFYVTVTDTIAPTLITKNTTLTLDANGTAYLNPNSVIASLSDNCSSQAAPVTTVSPSYFTSKGTYTVQVSAKDKYNNTVTKPAKVTVQPYKAATSGALIVDNKASLKNNLEVLISPNPAKDQFALQMKSSNLNKATLKILDASGKILKVFSSIKTGEVVHFGSELHAGIYMAEISIGTDKKIYKLVKL